MSLHIDAEAGDIAETVLLPGDPLRARHIAEHYLEAPRPICRRRNMLGYSGVWRGQPLSVLGTGMGMPSLAIYVTELVRDYGVRRLLRVGTCGALQPDLPIGQLILALGAGSDSSLQRDGASGAVWPAVADADLLRAAFVSADALQRPLRTGAVFSTDAFYAVDDDPAARLRAHGVLAVDMETAALYVLAARLGAQALSLLAVSDQLCSGATMPAHQREQALGDLFDWALATAHQIDRTT